MKYNFLIIFILGLFFIGCEKTSDEIVSINNSNFRISSLQAPTVFSYSAISKNFTTELKIENSSEINNVYLVLRSYDGKEVIYDHISMYDDGNRSVSGDLTINDEIYSAIVEMDESISSGKYIIEYFIDFKYGLQTINQKVAVHQFAYENGSANIAPVIFDVVAPDTVIVNPPKSVFVLSVSVADSNGYQDISGVYFVTYRPDGSTNGNKSYLLDNGESDNGDAVAGDGRYSLIVEVNPTNVKGEYTFEFQARDRGSKLSNIITHKISIQ